MTQGLENLCEAARYWGPLVSACFQLPRALQPFSCAWGERDCLSLSQGGGLFRARWHGRGQNGFHLQLQPALRIFLRLKGRYAFILKGAVIGEGEAPSCLLHGLPASAPGSLMLSCSASHPEQENELLAIVLPLEWLGLLGGHADAWQAGFSVKEPDSALRKKMCELSDLLDLGRDTGMVWRLRVEAQVLDLVADVIEQNDAIPSVVQLPADRLRMLRLKDFFDSGGADGMQLAEIARYAACNVSSLQSQFKAAFGRTVCDYLRESRLRRVAERIENEGISLAQAAELAGYGSQANFSTAFRRCFGVSPRQVKAGMVKLGEVWKRA